MTCRKGLPADARVSSNNTELPSAELGGPGRPRQAPTVVIKATEVMLG